MAKKEEKKTKEVRVKDVQRGVWNPETLSEKVITTCFPLVASRPVYLGRTTVERRQLKH